MRLRAAIWGVWLAAVGAAGCQGTDADPASPYGCGNGLDTDLTFDTNGLDVDNDGDGLTELEGDCDDNNCNVHPGAVDVNNGVDADCDGILPPLYGCGVTEYEGANQTGRRSRRATMFPLFAVAGMMLVRRATRSRRGVDGVTP